ncbi:hypothetical protein [Alteromonas ponticola]|uniref:Two component regulator three Y domain-containing protein n=1 Tax=Alteromonas ponticola TaxID=2720613 RepID=A0ABX1R3K3_9ALTE|nr:hypothetical protein [Alteromonas ponticola]NMH61025.1 hypothetical protein [Alteromonas ponticola]
MSSTVAHAAERSQAYSSNDGVITVPWQSDYATYNHFHILDATGSKQSTYPVIAGQGWVVSGLPNGNYDVVLSSANSERLIGNIRVEHYSLQSAFTLFAIGALMFAYLIFTLLKHQRSTSSHD